MSLKYSTGQKKNLQDIHLGEKHAHDYLMLYNIAMYVFLHIHMLHNKLYCFSELCHKVHTTRLEEHSAAENSLTDVWVAHVTRPCQRPPELWCTPGVSRSQGVGQIQCTPVFVNQILFEHSQDHLCTRCLRLYLLEQQSRVRLTKPDIPAVWPFTETFANFW